MSEYERLKKQCDEMSERDVAEARDVAIEDCAVLAESYADQSIFTAIGRQSNQTALCIAAAIRSLKSAHLQPGEKG